MCIEYTHGERRKISGSALVKRLWDKAASQRTVSQEAQAQWQHPYLLGWRFVVFSLRLHWAFQHPEKCAGEFIPLPPTPNKRKDYVAAV